MTSRTKTEDIPALKVEGAGRELLSAMQRRHAHVSDFTDDEPTVPGFKHNKEQG